MSIHRSVFAYQKSVMEEIKMEMRDIVVAGMAIVAVGAGVLCWWFENFGPKSEDKKETTEEHNDSN